MKTAWMDWRFFCWSSRPAAEGAMSNAEASKLQSTPNRRCDVVSPQTVSGLRYIQADYVTNVDGDTIGTEVLGSHGRSLGHLDGVLVDFYERKLRYIVVDTRDLFSRHRYLLPPTEARLDRQRPALRLDIDEESISTFPEFSAKTRTVL
jgi:hypothetical protein